MDKNSQASTINGIAAGISAWLILAPFTFNYIDQAAKINDIGLGIILGAIVIFRVVSRFRIAPRRRNRLASI